MIEAIRELRDQTGASIGEIRSALVESGGDTLRAREILSSKFGAIAAKKSGREVKAGIVDAYIHGNGRIGVLLELQSETDFVARNPEFKALAHELSLHIAAMAPQDRDALLGQEYVKNPARLVKEIIEEAIGKFGENIQVGNFVRFEL